MGLCQCGADDRYTHTHFTATSLGVSPLIVPGVLGGSARAPVYALNWRPWCAACAETAAKAGLFLFGAQCLHTDPAVTPV